MLMIIFYIILIILLLVLLVAMLIDKNKHPEDYEIPKPRGKHRRIPKYTYTGLPWMGGKKIKNY